MNIKVYIKNRRLEMVGESQELEKQRATIVAQSKQLQIAAESVNAKLIKLSVELELLCTIEASANGHKEVEQCSEQQQ